MEYHSAKGQTIPRKQVLQYSKGGVLPDCPSGGTYSLGAVGEIPTRTVAGHALAVPF